jgi:hypothetical protein
LSEGFAWKDGGKLLYLLEDFFHHCGTSHIIRSDLYDIPADLHLASDGYLRYLLGSHGFIDAYLEVSGNSLRSLPFPGAVYRIGHRGSHSQSGGIFEKYFLKKEFVRHPAAIPAHLRRLRRLDQAVAEEFFGASR